MANGDGVRLPGAGQLYLREGSGVWFALAEVVGWTANRIQPTHLLPGLDRGFATPGKLLVGKSAG